MISVLLVISLLPVISVLLVISEKEKDKKKRKRKAMVEASHRQLRKHSGVSKKLCTGTR